MPLVNKYRIEKAQQHSQISSYIQPVVFNETGTQSQMLSKLADFADFLLETESPVAVVCGGHGSGKSTLLAKLVYDMESGPKDVVAAMDRFDSAASHRLLRTKLMQHLEDVQLKLDVAEASNGPSSAGASPAKKELSLGIGDSFMDGVSRTSKGSAEANSVLKLQMERLLKTDLSSIPWRIRLEAPKVVYFFKTAVHDTLDLMSYLCSALRGSQDTALATWHRVEELIREVVSPSRNVKRNGSIGCPLLLILDSLNEMEREHMCRIAVSFRGMVRLVMSADSPHIGQSVKGKGNGWSWNGCTVFWNGPLHIDERKAMLSAMIDRLGPKKIPAVLDTFVLRQCCGHPVYLSTVCAYFRSCVDLSISPSSLSKLSYSAVDILVEQMFPTIEGLVGREAVMWYLEIVSSDPSGFVRTKAELLLDKCLVSVTDESLKLLTIAFRPLSDPGQTYATEKITLTRPFIKQAIFERYHSRYLPHHISDNSSQAGSDDVPPSLRRATSLTNIQGIMSDKDTEDGEENWLSDDEYLNLMNDNPDVKGSDGKVVNSPHAHLEFECWFGSVMLLCNKALFEKFCSADSLTSSGEFHSRSKTMDLNELLHLLRFTCIFPNHVSKSDVIKAFTIANKHAQKHWVYDITIQNTLTSSDHGM